jgi:hypothetical protein
VSAIYNRLKVLPFSFHPVGVKETTADGCPPGIADKGEFIHYTFQRFHCLTQQKRFEGQNQPQSATAPQNASEQSSMN